MRKIHASTVLIASALVTVAFQGVPSRGQEKDADLAISDGSRLCLGCHQSKAQGGAGVIPSVADHWAASAHARAGVGCLECHGVPAPDEIEDFSNPRYVVKTTWDQATGLKTVELTTEGGAAVERPDLWNHVGSEIVLNVTPRTCAMCHPQEVQEFVNSRHSSAAQFLGSVDNFLGRFVEGPAAANNGCQQCHGGEIRMATDQPASASSPPRYAPDTWPNSGIGRVNPDGSWGACSACHPRHEFSSAVARRPENCGKCHVGPDHPQLEIYKESKHGILYDNRRDELEVDAPAYKWILGETYSAAPTCVTCHMGAVAPHARSRRGLSVNHDVGARISWTLRPPVSVQPPAITTPDGKQVLAPPAERREAMQQVCTSCHGQTWVSDFYVQYDQAVELYNGKFGRPSKAIYEFLQSEGIVDAIPMNEEMDFLYFEIWHHEGRRARHGASMMGPDYVQWHGFYELSRNLYTHFLPLAQKLADQAGKGALARDFIRKTLGGEGDLDWQRYHAWTEGLTAEQRQQMLQWEREAYGKAETP